MVGAVYLNSALGTVATLLAPGAYSMTSSDDDSDDMFGGIGGAPLECESEEEEEETEEQRAAALALKKDMAAEKRIAGNDKFRAKLYQEALALYSEAFLLDPSDPVVYSNRAACFSALGQVRHQTHRSRSTLLAHRADDSRSGSQESECC